MHARFCSGFVAILGSAALGLACGGSDGAAHTRDTAGGDNTGEVVGTGPTLTALRPSEGAVLKAGDPVELSVQVIDPGADLAQVSVTWTSDRATVPLAVVTPDAAGRATATLTTLAAGAHVLTIRAVDADAREATATLRLTIDGLPTPPVLAITPAAPTTVDELVATVTTASTDPDGSAVTLRYHWFVDGVDAAIETATVPAARTTKGETWKVAVLASDTSGNTRSATAEVVIANSAPTCATAFTLPNAGNTAATFTCSCLQRADLDDDAPADTCTFLIDGVELTDTDGACTLDPSRTEHGQSIVCRLTPSDGEATGAPVESAASTVLNAPPSAPSVTLAPTDADAATTLTCTVTAPGVDPDQDSLVHAIAWEVNGAIDPAPVTPAVVAGTLARGGGATAHRGDSVRCLVTASDGTATSSPSASQAVVLTNAAPTIDEVRVHGPDGAAASEGTSVTCDIQGAHDADGDTLTPTVTWVVGGTVVPGETGLTLGSEHFARGDIVTCSASVSDGVASSKALDAKVVTTIVNAAPVVAAVTVAPAQVTRRGTLTCDANGVSDADGDPVTLAFAWRVDGVLLPDATGSTLAAAGLQPGAVVACEVTPTDGTTAGTSRPSGGSATVVNTEPTLAGALLGPENARVGATLTCTPTGYTDPDGDPPTYTYVWTKNAVPVADATSNTLSGGFGKGDHVRCRVRVSDGAVTTPEVLSNDLVIRDSLPTIGDVVVEPGMAGTCGDFVCNALDVADADGDIVTLAYTWTRNGEVVAGQVSKLFLGAQASGDQLVCTVRPSDGELDGEALVYGQAAVSEAAYVENVAPSVATVTIAPADAGVGDVVTCEPAGWADDCTSQAGYGYAWYVAGNLVAGANGATLDTDGFALGDAVTCVATPKDELASGAPTSSAPLLLQKGAPVAPVVVVSAPEGANGPVTCTITQNAQWFDHPTYTYYWSTNGGPEVAAPATLDEAAVASCDVVTCRVEVQDATARLLSDAAMLELPYGSDCEDGNDCTSHVCKPGGGCLVVPESGLPCEDADPCSATGVCNAGTCEATGNLCSEEILNVPTTAGWTAPRVAAMTGGRYIVQWLRPDQDAENFVRIVSAEDSREGEQQVLDSATGKERLTRPIGLPDGGALALELKGVEDIVATYPLVSVDVVGHRFGASGEKTDATFFASMFHSCSGTCRTWLYNYQAVPVDLGGLHAALAVYTQGAIQGSASWATPYGLRLFPATGEIAGQSVVVVAPDDMAQAPYIWDAVGHGGPEFVAGWVAADGKTVKARRFTFTDPALTAEQVLTVKTEAGFVAAVRVADLAQGGFAVAWEVNLGGTAGREVYVQIYAADLSPRGVAVRVNPTGSGDQRLGGVAGFSDGGFVAVFDDSRGDTTDYGVKARLFDAAGVAGATITLNETPSGDQTMPDVAVLDVDDEWVAVWIDASTGANKALRTRRFYRDGAPAPGIREQLAPTAQQGDQTRPQGAAGTGDRVFMVWESPSLAAGGGEIGGRLFGPDGKALGPEIVVNEVTAGAQTAPAVAGGANRFVVAWERPDGTSTDIAMRIFDGDGKAQGAETLVHDASTGSERQPAVALGSDGGFVVAWVAGTSTASRVKLRGWDKDGRTIVDELAVDGGAGLEVARPRVAWVPGGKSFTVTWQSKHATQGWDILMRRVTPGASSGATTLGAESVANAAVVGDQQVPAIAVGATGVTTVCWETGDDIVCQTFQANGTTAVAEFKPHVKTAGVQKGAALRHTSQGRLLVAWETDGVDFEGTAVQVRQFPALGAPSGKRFLGNRQALSSQTRPFVVPLATQARYFVGWETPGQDGSGQGVVYRVLPTP